jgi:hypothetical protein
MWLTERSSVHYCSVLPFRSQTIPPLPHKKLSWLQENKTLNSESLSCIATFLAIHPCTFLLALKTKEDALDVLYKLTSGKCEEYFGCGRALPVTPHSLSLFARAIGLWEKFKACAATYGSHRLGTAPPNRPPTTQWAWALVTLSNLHRGRHLVANIFTKGWAMHILPNYTGLSISCSLAYIGLGIICLLLFMH